MFWFKKCFVINICWGIFHSFSVLEKHIWLLSKCKILLRISLQHERALLIGSSKGRSLSSAVLRPFESGRCIGCAQGDRLSLGHPTAELCYVKLVERDIFLLAFCCLFFVDILQISFKYMQKKLAQHIYKTSRKYLYKNNLCKISKMYIVKIQKNTQYVDRSKHNKNYYEIKVSK